MWRQIAWFDTACLQTVEYILVAVWWVLKICFISSYRFESKGHWPIDLNRTTPNPAHTMFITYYHHKSIQFTHLSLSNWPFNTAIGFLRWCAINRMHTKPQQSRALNWLISCMLVFAFYWFWISKKKEAFSTKRPIRWRLVFLMLPILHF